MLSREHKFDTGRIGHTRCSAILSGGKGDRCGQIRVLDVFVVSVSGGVGHCLNGGFIADCVIIHIGDFSNLGYLSIRDDDSFEQSALENHIDNDDMFFQFACVRRDGDAACRGQVAGYVIRTVDFFQDIHVGGFDQSISKCVCLVGLGNEDSITAPCFDDFRFRRVLVGHSVFADVAKGLVCRRQCGLCFGRQGSSKRSEYTAPPTLGLPYDTFLESMFFLLIVGYVIHRLIAVFFCGGVGEVVIAVK